MHQRLFQIITNAFVAAALVGCGTATPAGPGSQTSVPLSPSAASSARPHTWNGGAHIYVGNAEFVNGGVQNEVLVFPIKDGNVQPIRTILPIPMNAGAQFLTGGLSIAVDEHGFLYALFKGVIGVYPPFADGPTMPVRYIFGDNSKLGNWNIPNGMDVDPDGTIYVSVNESLSQGGPYTGHILVFSPGASGDVAPARDIPLFDSTGNAAFIDAVQVGKKYIFTSESATSSIDLIAKDASAPGTYCQIVPSEGIQPEFKAPFDGPLWVEGLDANNEPIVSAYQHCQQAPTHTLSGDLTGFLDVQGITGDGKGNLIVNDKGDPNLPAGTNPSIRIFAPKNQNGNVKPNKVIKGPATHLFIQYSAITVGP